MKKIFYILALPVIFDIPSTHAEMLEDGKFFEDVLISEDVKLEDDSLSARNKASALLNQKPKTIKIEGMPAHFRSHQSNSSFNQSTSTKPIDTTTKYGESPFGMSWGATYNQTKALGVELKSIKRKDGINEFIVTQLPKPLSDFRQVIVSFGENNSLWKIDAYGRLIEDDDSVTKGLHLYHKYYKLLEMKYGNAKETYTPKISIIDVPYKDDYGVDKIRKEKRAEPIGGANFKTELQNREASLYATFENADVGAALALTVDENGKSYIIIDYTNLRIFREQEQDILNAL